MGSPLVAMSSVPAVQSKVPVQLVAPGAGGATLPNWNGLELTVACELVIWKRSPAKSPPCVQPSSPESVNVRLVAADSKTRFDRRDKSVLRSGVLPFKGAIETPPCAEP